MKLHYVEYIDTQEASVAHEHNDPRTRHDDPLLDGLLILCAPQGKPAGLPLAKQRLTVSLLPRVARHAWLQGRVLKRPLDGISDISLPAMLLLREGRSAVLLGQNDDGSARIMPSETEGGEIHVDRNMLQQNYLGLVLFATPRHAIDIQNESLISHTKSWFQGHAETVALLVCGCGAGQFYYQYHRTRHAAVRDECV